MREPLAEILRGLEVEPLGDGATPVEAVIVVKAMLSDGEMVWVTRSTAGLNDAERIGALTMQLDLARTMAVRNFVPDDGGDV